MSIRRDGRDSRGGGEADERGGFLGRWSRLKQEAAHGRPAVDTSDVPAETGQETPADEAPAEEAARVGVENQEAAEAIDIDSLEFSSDYSAFLKQGVSRELKRRALRKLWTSDPVLACVDGLNDYDEDFRNVEVLSEGFRSSWQVGRGFGWMDEKAEDAAGDEVPVVESVSDKIEAEAPGDDMQDASSDGEAIDFSDDPPREMVSAELASEPDDPEAVFLDPEGSEPVTRPQKEPVRPPSRRRMRFE
ncbi:MAG: hypothetical protein CMN86_22165 [Stappia sp.]|nr:hypothetical protein [Stappia sp.]